MGATSPRSRRVRLRLEFDGALFCGWQLQSDVHESRRTSVQGEVERALRVLTRSSERIVVQGCGRTDAGVSAREFFAHFDMPEAFRLPEGDVEFEKFRHSLNGILPEGVAVTRLDTVAADFHALKDVVWKTYEYSLLLRRAKATLERNSCYWIPESSEVFRIDELRRTLEVFEGRHDFVAFAAADHTAKTTVREIFETKLLTEALGVSPSDGLLLRLHFTGEGFLKYMVRTLAGTLVEVGQGKRDAASVSLLLDGTAQRPEAGHCAPAHALRLIKVSYEPRRAP